MLSDGRDPSIVQRGIDEAFACQDMLPRAPIRPSFLDRAKAWIAPFRRAAILPTATRRRPTFPAAPRRAP